MLRATALPFACLVLVGCPGPQHPKPVEVDQSAVRIAVARAEALRAGGMTELVERAGSPRAWERALALRALGRIGGARAIDVLRGALADADPDVIAAAAAGIGVAASLDDETADAATTAALEGAVGRAGSRAPVVIEAIGRAAGAASQVGLIEILGGGAAANAEAAAIALGRYGRRKIALSSASRAALSAATSHGDATIRYAAVWALAREHEPPADTDVALATKLLALAAGDPQPEVRAQAVAALGRRKLCRWPAPRSRTRCSIATGAWRSKPCARSVAMPAARARAMRSRSRSPAASPISGTPVRPTS
jgi:HEAT repeat protein